MAGRIVVLAPDRAETRSGWSPACVWGKLGFFPWMASAAVQGGQDCHGHHDGHRDQRSLDPDRVADAESVQPHLAIGVPEVLLEPGATFVSLQRRPGILHQVSDQILGLGRFGVSHHQVERHLGPLVVEPPPPQARLVRQRMSQNLPESPPLSAHALPLARIGR